MTRTIVPAYVGTAATPAGDATFAVDGRGALVGLQFDEGDYSRPLVDDLAGDGFDPVADAGRTAAVRAAIDAYGRGDARALDDVAVATSLGSAWQAVVWQGLRAIPFGQVRTYAGVAAAIGRPTAVRAVARANATNRFPLVVPCHRVIGADGTLTGYGGGLHLKARLLDHERRAAGMPETWTAWHADTGA